VLSLSRRMKDYGGSLPASEVRNPRWQVDAVLALTSVVNRTSLWTVRSQVRFAATGFSLPAT
jgi:hypothetical protein